MLNFHKGFFPQEEKPKEREKTTIKTVEEIKRENPSLQSRFEEKKIKVEADNQKQNTFRASSSFEKMNGFRNIKK